MSSESDYTRKFPPFFFPLLISSIIILFYYIPLAASSLRGEYGAGIWGIFEILALLATIAAPFTYGWKTGDTTGAIIVGGLPFLGAMILPRIIIPGFPGTATLLTDMLFSIFPLCIIGGCEGYFASRREAKSLLIALALAGVWCYVFLSGIH